MEFEDPVPRPRTGGHDHEHEEGEEGREGKRGSRAKPSFPFVDFMSADARLQGFEDHADFQLTSRLFAEGGFDYMRDPLTSADRAAAAHPLRGRWLRYGDLVQRRRSRRRGEDGPRLGRGDGDRRLHALRAASSYSSADGKAVSASRLASTTSPTELYRSPPSRSSRASCPRSAELTTILRREFLVVRQLTATENALVAGWLAT